MLVYTLFSFLILSSFLYGELTQHWVSFDNEAFRYVVPWVAAHVLRIREPLTSSLAGDAPFQWVQEFVLLAIAAVGTLVWSVADRQRPDYRLLDTWLRPFVRLGLAAILFSYGFDKVYPNQFRSITRTDLIRQFGDLSHFNLIWNFMAASKGYTIFSGVLEVLAGILLLLPNLASAGAMLSVAVMSNVVALNLAYNIPVKLLSMNFLLMACYLAAPEVPRLYDLLVRNRAVNQRPPSALSSNRRLNRGVNIAQRAAGLVFFLAFFYTESRHYAETRRAESVPVPMQGIWLVNEFTVTGGPQSSLFTPKLLESMKIQPGEERWSRLVFDHPGQIVIQTTAGTLDFVQVKFVAEHEVLLTDSGDSAWKAYFKLQHRRPDLIDLQGSVNGLNVIATLHKMDESRFKVRDEGLHWVQAGR